jgi:hypothetical protein
MTETERQGVSAVRGTEDAALLHPVPVKRVPSDLRAMQTIDLLAFSDQFEHIAVYAVLRFLPSIRERHRLTAFGAVALGIALEYSQIYPGCGVLKSDIIWWRL